MSTSISLNRLASTSRCLYTAKSVPNAFLTRVRTYATESTSPQPRDLKSALSLLARLHKAGKKNRTSLDPPPPKPAFPHSKDDRSKPPRERKKPRVLVLPRAPKSTPQAPKKSKRFNVEPLKRVSVNEDASLGPGFVPESWQDNLEPSEQQSAKEKVVPPHVLPSVTASQGTISSGPALVDVAPLSEHLPVAKLEHGLDRVLFNPGVHWLQDPRSHVYNFTPWLEKIPKVNDFAFERLTGFISSSRDEDLRALAKQEQKKFAGSTSSMSGMLSHIYFLISQHKDVELTSLSQHFVQENPSFTSGQRMPSAVTLNYKDGVYAIDALGSELDDPDKNVLTWMGTLLENFLTKKPSDFNKFLRAESVSNKEGVVEKPKREAFRFAKSDNFVMRSQLDCQDNRLPGTGVFDIKTRAVVSIRMDILNFEENSGYMIKQQYGLLESFEREYYDLIRSAFLKYSLQVRIGNMDGVMVTYHNTERIFGFQYISLDEMDERLYGPVPGIGDKVFNKSITLLEAILEEAAKCYPDQSVKCLFETRRPGRIMDVYVQPEEWDQTKGQKPITQLLVEVSHRLDDEPAKAYEVLKSVDPQTWTMEYTISKAVLPADAIEHNRSSAEQRKTRLHILPSSVELKDAKEYWEGLCFNPKMEAVAKEFRHTDFTTADETIRKFREVSRQGRALYEELQRRREGKPKIVLGHGEFEEEESLFFKDVRGVAASGESEATTGERNAESETEQTED